MKVIITTNLAGKFKFTKNLKFENVETEIDADTLYVTFVTLMANFFEFVILILNWQVIVICVFPETGNAYLAR